MNKSDSKRRVVLNLTYLQAKALLRNAQGTLGCMNEKAQPYLAEGLGILCDGITRAMERDELPERKPQQVKASAELTQAFATLLKNDNESGI